MPKISNLLLLACSLLVFGSSHAQSSQEAAEAKTASPIVISKTTTCDWLAEATRMNHWYNRDQSVRSMDIMNEKDPEKIKKIAADMQVVDQALQVELDDLVQRCGWPGTTAFGISAPRAAFLIVQHADLPYQLKYLPYIKAAAEQGELPRTDWAMLDDRVRMGQELPQRFGSQLTSKDSSEYVLYDVEDVKHLNERRSEAGFIPADICTYLALFPTKVSFKPCDSGTFKPE